MFVTIRMLRAAGVAFVPGLALATLAAALIAGCATPTADKDEARAEPIYRTGSNLPVKDPSGTSRVQTVRPDETPILRPLPTPRPGGGG